MPFFPVDFGGEADAFPYSVHYRPLEPSRDRPPGIAKLEEGRFHVWRSGALATMLPTASAILVTRGFASALAAETTVGWHVREVSIFDPPNSEILGYVELVVAETFESHSLPSDVSGKRVWRFGPNYLFVSPELAKVLSARFSDLTFGRGLSGFAG